AAHVRCRTDSGTTSVNHAFQPLAVDDYRDLVRRALAEDVGRGDITTTGTIDGSQRVRAIFLAKSRCVIAGLDVALEAFRQLDPSIEVTTHYRDGSLCAPGTIVAEINGRADALLIGERTALNFMQRLSGIATLTRQFVDAAGGRIVVLDTRKTTPLMRVLEKYAVRAGGGTNHRVGLDDGVLIKDNHVRLAGGVGVAVRRMREAGRNLPVEVEAQSLCEVDAALEAGADIVLLDNLSTPDIIEAVGKCRGKARTEISGGVTLSRIPELAATGADYVSVGALTHSAPAADLSFEIVMGSGVI
ncbi:MAG TPA: carboxylating nicotinate-nucleotide diphosphorylase, partial [Vicinamibacterales bacterium]|nr:carboxylating nicotinate-nucleotide diphosphorylase [Vicinamibacterales bacterium]